MRISDWSSDVCSSDLKDDLGLRAEQAERKSRPPPLALCPIRHMFFRMLERADRRHAVGHQRLFAAAMAEILADRLREILCMIEDRKSVVAGKRVSVRVDLGGSGIFKKKNKQQ